MIPLALVAGGLVLLGALSRSGYGLALRGIRDNERRMRAIGYRTTGMMLSAFAVSGAVCGLAGALLANYYLFVSPAYLHWLVSGELLVMAVLGGLTSPAGPLLGAVVLVAAELFLSSFTTYWRIILGPAVILVVLYLRRGLLEGLVSAFQRSRANG
jgi:branched-chain amino acid transport system permease protein